MARPRSSKVRISSALILPAVSSMAVSMAERVNPFHAISIEFEIAHLGGKQGEVDRFGVVVVREEVAVAFMDALKNDLIVPKGIVGIESDHTQILHNVTKHGVGAGRKLSPQKS
jgi:hypothetical protein